MMSIIFWIAILGFLHSYILYPYLLRKLQPQKQVSSPQLSAAPFLSIIIPAHNEDAVLRQKLESILASDYPPDRIELLIGLDCSTDLSRLIAEEYQSKFQQCRIFNYAQRQGKIKIVNDLVPACQSEIIVLSDANVLFTEHSLSALMAHFQHPKIGLVDSRMQHYGKKKSGISFPESDYISNEVRIKQDESRLWGSMMGPFGGCFAFRKACFQPIPSNFLVDDFYINMCCLEQGYQCITEEKALVYEDVSNELLIEFKRKIRISAGNFQNLKRFWKLLFRFNGLSFAFFSHKFLRWVLPLFFVGALLHVFQQQDQQLFYAICYYLILLIPITFIVDALARRQGQHIIAFRYIIHFVSMNVALLAGFFKFIGGIRSSVWQPTKRHQ
ncbi:MAG: hypothetical protein RLZZ301_1229 [Bacteroidota bacterium]|jgi:cellulose synthase/poly-beta-1,6-N-acetylglucosamine synthase-like glycosyltransferase